MRLLDGDDSTCLQFLGGVGGTGPWYTHLTIMMPQNGSFVGSLTGHNLGCGTSLSLVIESGDSLPLAAQDKTLGRRTKCQLEGTSAENGIDTCTMRCSCAESSCRKLNIIHRPMSRQEPGWQLCGINEGKMIYFILFIPPPPQTPHVNITCIDTMLYICYSFIVVVIFYSLYAQVPWNFLYACYVK